MNSLCIETSMFYLCKEVPISLYLILPPPPRKKNPKIQFEILKNQKPKYVIFKCYFSFTEFDRKCKEEREKEERMKQESSSTANYNSSDTQSGAKNKPVCQDIQTEL